MEEEELIVRIVGKLVFVAPPGFCHWKFIEGDEKWLQVTFVLLERAKKCLQVKFQNSRQFSVLDLKIIITRLKSSAFLSKLFNYMTTYF